MAVVVWFGTSTEGIVLSVGLFMMTLLMMVGLWFIVRCISVEPFTFYTFPGRLYTYRIISSTPAKLIVSNTHNAALMWPLSIIIFGILAAILLAALMTTRLWPFVFSVIPFWLWWTYMFCLGRTFVFDANQKVVISYGTWMGIRVAGSQETADLGSLVKCRMEERTRADVEGWQIIYYLVELDFEEPYGVWFLTKKRTEHEDIKPFVDTVNQFLTASRSYQTRSF